MITRLIDADKLIDFIDVGHLRHSGELCYSETEVANLLLHAPTVDAVPVVRCKDCKYRFKNNGHSKDGCPIIDANIWMDGNDFCSYGERKDGDENG